METNINYTVVGAFVITLIVATVLAIIWLSAGFSVERHTTYMVYMQESVSGLSIDSPVEFNGVEVGSIKSIEINHKNPHLVELMLSIKSSTPVTQGTVAMLDTRGITGVTYMALKDVGTNLNPLKVEEGQSYPIIRTSPSLFLRLDTALTNLNKNFGKIAESFQVLFSPENQRSIKQTLKQLDTFTSTLSKNSDHIDTILKNTSQASHELTPMLHSGGSAMQTLQTQTLPSTYDLINTMNAAAQSIAAFSAQLKQNPSILIRGAAPQTPGPGETP